MTGGDTASHLLYAARFTEWLLGEGRISGWMPEVFLGLPAFVYYFPLPFILIALLSPLAGLAVAFKWVAMLPALLLPAATYFLAGSLRWPAPARTGAALGATGFLLIGSFSIWGGNLLSLLAGEFAYAWGFAATLVFWGLLRRAMDHGGYRWALAALAEAAVALCHGYPLLIAGFGAFFLLRGGPGWKLRLRNLLLVHTAAFLLIAFWLLPLLENLPWTIPNDTTEWLDLPGWLRIADRPLWPLLAGWLLVPAALALCRRSRNGVFFLSAIGLLALVGFFWSSAVGLANVRFLPFAIWAVASLGGAAIGWALWRFSLRPGIWLLSCTLALLAWWSPLTVQIEAWSRWNLEGYEAKPLWPQYTQLATVTAGPLSGPRVIFEHDPANTDLGSTRALEALPMFGSRPVLEGLYMESALCGPFIYQAQAEISARPSSPLSRFPASSNSGELALLHLEELYADTLILRSQASIETFAANPRLQEIADPEPFRVFRIEDFSGRMVEPLGQPIDLRPRDQWLERAFRRFRLEFPYQRREVYSDREEQSLLDLPPIPASGNAEVRLLSLEPERIRFETDAPGIPHLVRMSYHPRWRSNGGETVHLVEPCFMLVVPEGKRVELNYERSLGDRLGLGLSFLGAIVLLLLLVRGPGPDRPASKPALSRSLPARSLIVLIGALAVAWGWQVSPQRAYLGAHKHFADRDYALAGEQFERAATRRRHPSRRAEARFWSGRSLQLADRPLPALETLPHARRRHAGELLGSGVPVPNGRNPYPAG